MLKLGIDDSGRGPVLGPMILSGVLIDSNLEKQLKKLGVKDSKLLNKEKREILAEIIRKKALSYHTSIILPQEIDARNYMGFNLNRVEAIKTAEIINQINKGLDKIKVIIDCPSRNIEKWTAIVKTYIEKKENLEFQVEHKADLNHISVSAASIIAKSKRESELEILRKKLKVEFGSGYCSDPITRKFLKDNLYKMKKHRIFRQTWQTYKNQQQEIEQRKLKDF